MLLPEHRRDEGGEVLLQRCLVLQPLPARHPEHRELGRQLVILKIRLEYIRLVCTVKVTYNNSWTTVGKKIDKRGQPG